MTGKDLKNKIKQLGLTQEAAAIKLGITRATLNNWCKIADLPPSTVENVKTFLGINDDLSNEPVWMETLRSQQKTIEELTNIIKNLTSKNQK